MARFKVAQTDSRTTHCHGNFNHEKERIRCICVLGSEDRKEALIVGLEFIMFLYSRRQRRIFPPSKQKRNEFRKKPMGPWGSLGEKIVFELVSVTKPCLYKLPKTEAM